MAIHAVKVEDFHSKRESVHKADLAHLVHKGEGRMQMDMWSIISIVLVIVGFFGGIWYEHR